MSIKHRTSAERVLAALKLTGMAAMALSFVMMLALTGCPTEASEPGGPAPVSSADLPGHLEGLSANDAGTPHTVKLTAVNISTGDVMGDINTKVKASGKYITLDLSACSAAENKISGKSSTPGPNDMNVIYDNEYIVGVILPDSLTSIGDYAFSRCSKLESVVIPARVTSIGNYAFSSCSKLASVGIPADVTDIGYGAFGYCSSLESVTIPAGATIESSAFQFCSKLLFTVSGTGSYSTLDEGKMLIKDGKELAAYPSASGAVELPGSITSIGRDAFYQCSSLTGITIPSSVTSIGMQAFSFCSGLTAVTVPATVTSIGTYAFYSCSNLTSITIPAGATIESSAFQFCSKLLFTVSGTGSYSASDDGKMLIKDGKELAAYPSANGAVTTLPNSITAIGNNAFYSNNSLTSVAIPSGVTSIGNYAFYNCSNLTSVTIPSSVDSIGESTFSRCSSLESVTFAAGSSISAANFDAGSIDYPTFPGDLRAKYLGMGGGAGRYTTTRQSNDNTTAVWTKTPQ